MNYLQSALGFLGMANNWLKERPYQYGMLGIELESDLRFLRELKMFTQAMLDSDVNLCRLPDLIDAINAVQIFLYEVFYGQSLADLGMELAFADWYRTELSHAFEHVRNALQSVQLELISYSFVITDGLIKGDDWDDIASQLRDKNSVCSAIHRSLAESDWDFCEGCLRNITGKGPSFLDFYRGNVATAADPETYDDVSAQAIKRAMETQSPLPETLFNALRAPRNPRIRPRDMTLPPDLQAKPIQRPKKRAREISVPEDWMSTSLDQLSSMTPSAAG